MCFHFVFHTSGTKPGQHRDKAHTRSGQQQQQKKEYAPSPVFAQGASAASRHTGLALAHTHTLLCRAFPVWAPLPQTPIYVSRWATGLLKKWFLKKCLLSSLLIRFFCIRFAGVHCCRPLAICSLSGTLNPNPPSKLTCEL